MQRFALYNFIWIMVFLEQATASLDPKGANVCSKQESYVEGYTVSYQNSITQKVSYKCLANGQGGSGWLKFYKICYKNHGWQQAGTSCTTPICSQGCSNGNCTKPDVCTCRPGYQGKTCMQPCSVNQWGPGCNNTCQCRNNATCDVRNGFCSCAPGWRGDKCELPCQQGFYGNSCLQSCACQNGARCNHVTGKCTCAPGWSGQYCNHVCNSGNYGDKCQQTCQCQNNATCDHVTGACACRPGYQGPLCEKSCENGYYGDRCKQRCKCVRGSCDHVIGTCFCPEGYIGVRCDKICTCPTNATCREDGTCVCAKGFTGESCDKTCSSGYYGSNCQSKCSCHEDQLCEPFDGNCTCEGSMCYQGGKASKEKRTEDSANPLLPIVLSVSLIVFIAVIIAAFFVWRRRRINRKEPNTNPIYEITDSTAHVCNGSKQGDKENNQLVSNTKKPSYMELSQVTQRTKSKSPVYQGLKSRVQHEPRDIGIDNSGRDVYQPLKTNTELYQSLDRETDRTKSPARYSNSPALYGNLPHAESRVDDDNELYLTVLPDQDVRGQSNMSYDKGPGFADSSTSSELYENLPSGKRLSDEDELYLTVLPNHDEDTDQPTYEILPTT